MESNTSQSIDTNQLGFTQLHFLAESNAHALCAELLCAGSENVNAQTNRGHSALHIAAAGGHIKVIELLLCQPEININLRDANGDTALHLSARKGFLRIYSTLKASAECDMRIRNNQDCTAEADLYRYLLRKTRFGMFEEVVSIANLIESFHHYEQFQETPLHKACTSKLDALEKVEFLIRKDPSQLNRLNRTQYTPLHIAAASADSSLLRFMLNCNLAVRINASGRDQNIPLHIAAKCGRIGNVQLLLQRANIDACALNADCMSALDIAYSKGYGAIVQLLENQQ